MDDSDDRVTLSLIDVLHATGRFHPRTGEMIDIDDRDYMQFSAPGFNEVDKVDSFHYHDGSKLRAAPVFGLFSRIDAKDFSHVGETLLRYCARDILGGESALSRAVAKAREAIEEMEQNADGPALANWIRAVRFQNRVSNADGNASGALRLNASGGVDLPSNVGTSAGTVAGLSSFSLPPLFGSGKGFAAIRQAVRSAATQATFAQSYPYLSYEACKEVSDLYPMLRKLYDGCRSALPVHEVLDLGFDAFFDVFVGRQRVPIWLSKVALSSDPNVSASTVTSGLLGAAAAAGGVSQALVDEALQSLFGVSRAALAALQNSLSGKTSHVEVERLVREGGAIPDAARIGVELGAGRAAGNAVVFDGTAGGVAPANAPGMPEFGKVALQGFAGQPIAAGGPVAYDEESLRTADANVRAAYVALKRFEHNFVHVVNNDGVEQRIESDKIRAAVLGLLGHLSAPKKAADVPAAAGKIKTVVDALLVPLIGRAEYDRMSSAPSSPNKIRYEALKKATVAFLEDPANRALFGTKTVATIMSAFTAAEQAAAVAREEVAKLTPSQQTDAVAATRGFSASDYVPSGLVAGPAQFAALVGQFVGSLPRPTFALSDPRNLGAIATRAQLSAGAALVSAPSIGDDVPISLLPASYYERRVGPPAAHLGHIVLGADRRPHNPNAYTTVVSTSISESIAAQNRREYEMMEVERTGMTPGEFAARSGAVRSRHFDDDDGANLPAIARAEARVERRVADPRLPDGFAHKRFGQMWDGVDSAAGNDLALSVAAKVVLTASTNRANWDSMHEKDVVVPATVLVARPFWTLEGLMVLKVARGGSTAKTYVARPTTSWGDNAQIQAWTLTTTYYAKTIVINRKNIYRVRASRSPPALSGFLTRRFRRCRWR